jgi:hypothetical protein
VQVGFEVITPAHRLFLGGVGINDNPHHNSFCALVVARCRCFDFVGKTLVPEAWFARKIGAHFSRINPVVNPAEGLLGRDSGAAYHWTTRDLSRIYDPFGPTISTVVPNRFLARLPNVYPMLPARQRPPGKIHPVAASYPRATGT